MRRQNTLYVMIGVPGSGKDTIANMLKEHIEENGVECAIVSSDDIRVELFGFEDQEHNEKVFAEMRKRSRKALQEGKDVIYNATNLNIKRRKNIINETKKIANVEAILCLCSIGTLFDRNLTRPERHIPEDKLLSMIRNIDIPMYYEGFDKIHYANTDTFPCDEIIDLLTRIGYNYEQGNIHHTQTLIEHLLNTCDKAYKWSDGDEILRRAGRFHDIGKPYCRGYNEEKQTSTYYSHHKVSAYLYLLYANCYKHRNFLLTEVELEDMQVATLIYHHMDKFIADLDKTKEKIGEELFSKLEILMKADADRSVYNGEEE